ncbi:bifunctional diaminohydroxyphosphoribosylaminopyrimidine deaminase/5-amino-6-(5-phosphoribosylamino)uracil reductase RibD [Calderihabitans maritimus]|nr:bifunctional diaminohydroxyphosphoribosylaminopyrimidine deaminase/5-amino-6-(5-phosphoribosylamino)uracil reductase RibD [Calderihabitans maritimus]
MDEFFMREALNLARNGLGRTSPNPAVGALIVKEGRVIGRGYHRKAGTPHAEILALREAGKEAEGATLYVNLEPCSHYGRTPPCSEAIIKAGIKRVVAAMVDPNPKVAGRGLAHLKAAGIKVKVGVLEEEARKLNEFFIKHITTGFPFVTLKGAMTLDGKIATVTGDSRWVTGPLAREYVHQLRDQYDAIMVGVGTVLADDPLLTTRLPEGQGRDPVRVIVDSRLRIPLEAKVVNISEKSSAPTIVATTNLADPERKKVLEDKGVEVLTVNHKDSRVDLNHLMMLLGQRGIISVLLEGGAQLNASAIEAGIVDKILMFIAPKIIGGSLAPGPVGGRGIEKMQEALLLHEVEVTTIGADVLISAYIRKGED